MIDFALIKTSSCLLLEEFLVEFLSDFQGEQIVENLDDKSAMIIGAGVSACLGTVCGNTLRKQLDKWECVTVESIGLLTMVRSIVMSQDLPLIEVYCGNSIWFATDVNALDLLFKD